jgi:hypothetical protein
MPQDAETRFWSKVDASGVCWEWTAAKLPYGYGFFWYIDRMVRAHRWAYEDLVGPIPNGLTLDHLCRNPPCVNPDHLEPVTAEENISRSKSYLRGAAHQRAKTHCPSGHPLLGDNLYTTPDNKRRCRVCRRESLRRSRAKHMPEVVYMGPGKKPYMQLAIEDIS